MTDDLGAVFEAPLGSEPPLDELVRATMAWHFSATTGSPYWVGRLDELPFDPVSDVKTFADLGLFADVDVDWSTIPAGDLIPAGCVDGSRRFGVYESGGATGAPKRIVDATARARNVMFQNRLLDEQGFPVGPGGWLHIGPTGPHIMAKNVATLAAMRGLMSYYIDLDPRWVRRCLGQGRTDLFQLYLNHLLDQIGDVLASQDIRAISSTPPVLAQLARRPRLCDALQPGLRGVIWGGTNIDAESLHLLEAEMFPDAVVAGAYGNTMMGVAPQRTRRDGDPAPCIFRPYFPYSVVEIVDHNDPAVEADVGTPGRVKITSLTRELFVPPVLERDQATRWRPPDAFAGTDISGVQPNATADGPVIVGVY
jgi:hypothetical protein